MNTRRITDGVIFQAVLTGSLSFSHIHDVAAAHGQDGWKAWLYPLSVDLLTVAAYRKLTAARRDHAPAVLAWCSFLLGLAASLAANVAESWDNPDRAIAVALGVWPAVAFLVCTLLSHDQATTTTETAVAGAHAPAVEPAAPAPALKPARSAPRPAPAPAPPSAADLSKVAPAFLAFARKVADDHHAATGRVIDPATLRTRLKVAEPLALALHRHVTAEATGA